ncbi:unnamed protein product [Adineta ricciae]|uniref:Uncharacterized protein n=1 Tax=Adineta ricciae TaxID=249248 RepID=A0A813YKU1_ADIRI|nr:unnamed protein product [Adineta ricciae]CAF0996870.1 unnamed protein product [Adineta ricciae]
MKRQSESNECQPEKRSKNEAGVNDFLRLNDSHFTETDYQDAFHTIANKLINEYELVFNDQTTFRLVELEFYFYHELRHADSFAHRHPEQQHYENWYFHRQGTSATASYKAGTYKGLDITFGSTDGSSYGGILIRSIKNLETNEIYEGSCLVVNAILELCKSETIKDLVELKLLKNLNVFNRNSFIYLRPSTAIESKELIASPRVGLTLKVPSLDRERFLFRPYRFTPKDYYPAKMRATIMLALAVEKYFNTKQGKFTDYVDDIGQQFDMRSGTITTNLKDFQLGYETNTSKKTSPLVDYHKKTWTAADIAKAYGIWVQKYRTN